MSQTDENPKEQAKTWNFWAALFFFFYLLD